MDRHELECTQRTIACIDHCSPPTLVVNSRHASWGGCLGDALAMSAAFAAFKACCPAAVSQCMVPLAPAAARGRAALSLLSDSEGRPGQTQQSQLCLPQGCAELASAVCQRAPPTAESVLELLTATLWASGEVMRTAAPGYRSDAANKRTLKAQNSSGVLCVQAPEGREPAGGAQSHDVGLWPGDAHRCLWRPLRHCRGMPRALPANAAACSTASAAAAQL